MRCWGSNAYGQTDVPPDLGQVTKVSAGYLVSCALTSDGTLRCWGGSRLLWGDLRVGTFADVSVGPSTNACSVSTGGTGECWGYGSAEWPSDLAMLTRVSVGAGSACAVTTEGTVRCWGNNSAARPPSDLGKVTSVSAGFNHTCAVTAGGTVRCWGNNTYGEVEVPPDLGRVTRVSAGFSHTCAVTTEGTVRCWGDNSSGQAEVPPDLGKVGVGNETAASPLPSSAITGAYPNPSRGRVTVRYALPVASPVQVDVVDVLGRRVALLHEGAQPAGEHTAVWDGAGASGGVYFARVQTPRRTLVRTVTLER